jgi:cyclohexanone monooxygenase
MFMLTGPQATYANIPSVLDKQAAFIGRAIAHMQAAGYDRIEVTPEAAGNWARYCEQILDATVIPQGAKAGSYLVGADIPGKSRILFHFGGANNFFDHLEKAADNGFEAFTFDRSTTTASPVTAH